MQVNVKNSLRGRFPIRQKEVHPLTFQVSFAQRGGDVPRCAEHPRALVIFQVRQVRSVPVRDDQQMTGVDGLDIHKKGRAGVVPVDEAGVRLSGVHKRRNLFP